ncbi:MAG: NADPH-dependent oxidoreductase [Anaerolineae bacterium]|jgi:nitroreductase|nr:NADPH-dependent oxidoreductase [Anaerolineae bacterium]
MTTHLHEVISRPTLETLQQHVSIRRYLPAPIAQPLLDDLLNAARRSPTSSNMQAYSLVVVQAAETRQRLAALAGDQKHIEQCPVFVAICADVARLHLAAGMHGTTLAQNLENSMVAVVDAALAGMSLATAAESVGLGTVMIGAMRNHPVEVAELLGLPAGVFVVYGLCLGYYEPERKPAQKPRLPAALIIHHERYQPADPAALAAHDAELAAHYRSEGRTTPDAAWTGVIAEKFSRPQRPHLRALLEKLGFRFD